MTPIALKPDLGSVLSTLDGVIQKHKDPVDRFLQQINEQSGPFQTNTSIFGNYHIIMFTDWAMADNASDVWNNYYSSVIKPLRRRDFQFIFHLGNVATRQVFDVDEVLDVIGDYASLGKATMILDNYEANNLWSMLNSQAVDGILSRLESPATRERYFLLFNTMHVDFLLILCNLGAMLISRDGIMDLEGKSPPSPFSARHFRNRFSVGYQLGLMLELEAPHCTALGLALSGGPSGFDSTLLLSYIQDWQNILFGGSTFVY